MGAIVIKGAIAIEGAFCPGGLLQKRQDYFCGGRTLTIEAGCYNRGLALLRGDYYSIDEIIMVESGLPL